MTDTKPTVATTNFASDDSRPYTWTMLLTVSASETTVADGFDPFDPEQSRHPREVIDYIARRADSWGEEEIEIVDVRPIAVPDREHVRRAQGYRGTAEISQRDRKVLSEVIGRIVADATRDGVDVGDRLRDFCESMELDADGADVQAAIDAIHSVEHEGQ